MILGSLGTNFHDFLCLGERLETIEFSWLPGGNDLLLGPTNYTKRLAAGSRKQTVDRRD